MSSLTPRVATPDADSAALCALARRCPQGRLFRFYHDRDHFWERCRLHRDSRVLVIDGDPGPLATVTFARKTVWLAGAERPAVYVFDLMVDPEQRGRGLARRLLRSVREHNPAAPLIYSHIVEDNFASRRLFESEGYRPFLRRVLYHPVLPILERRQPPPGLIRNATADVDAELRRRYDFLDSTARHDEVFALERHGGRAWAALRRHEPQVFVGLPWYAAILGGVLPVVPRPGRPVTVWSLHHLCWRGDAGALRRLIRAAAWLASRQRADALVLPLFEDDPVNEVVRPLTLTRWAIPPGAAVLHAAGELAPLLLHARRPLLLSDQDA